MSTKEEAQRKLDEGDYAQAEKIYKELRIINPDLDVITGLASIYLDQGNPQAALTLMELEEERFKDEPLFYKYLAGTYVSIRTDTLKNKDKALAAIFRAIEIDDKNPDFRSVLGYVYWFFGETEKALKETEEALHFALIYGDELVLLKIKNNLSYYYAMLGVNEQKAREYAEFCFQNREQMGKRKAWLTDSYAFIKIKFAKDVKEIDEAISLLIEAVKEGYPFDTLFVSHLKEAFEKRSELTKAANS